MQCVEFNFTHVRMYHLYMYQLKLYNQQKLARRQRRRFRKTVSGALDITEDITVAVLGNPQLSAACHHTADSTVPSEAPTPPPSRMPSSGTVACSVIA